MVTILRIIVVLVGATTIGSTGPIPPPGIEHVELHGASTGWYDDITWAHGRFGAAGLAPVDVTIHVWADAHAPACQGHAGLFTPTRSSRRIDVCLPLHESDLGDEIRRKVLLHELAHAWVHQHVDPPTRAAFMQLRGSSSWNDPHQPHYVRGTERAANAMMWALLGADDTPIGATIGYDLLTGPRTPGLPAP